LIPSRVHSYSYLTSLNSGLWMNLLKKSEYDWSIQSMFVPVIGCPTHPLASCLEVSARSSGHEKAKARLF
jgi:hypothetical protein